MQWPPSYHYVPPCMRRKKSASSANLIGCSCSSSQVGLLQLVQVFIGRRIKLLRVGNVSRRRSFVIVATVFVVVDVLDVYLIPETHAFVRCLFLPGLATKQFDYAGR